MVPKQCCGSSRLLRRAPESEQAIAHAPFDAVEHVTANNTNLQVTILVDVQHIYREA